MKKWVIFLLVISIVFAFTACKGNEDIVGEIEGPDGIDQFAGLWYCENRDLWVEVYYDGTWCTFEDGGMLRSFGSMTIQGNVGSLEPTEGTDSFILTAKEGGITDDLGNTMFKVTEVGTRKPLIVNDLGIPDVLEKDATVEGKTALSFAKEYEGFYISEDGIFALEVFADGTFELQEYGLLVESGDFLRLAEPDYGEIYSVDRDMMKYRLVIPQEERIYLGGCGIFAPGEKATTSDE